jgi:Family of unknown function (DUF6049)
VTRHARAAMALCAAVAMTVPLALCAAPAASAAAAQPGGPPPVSLAITSVSPAYARPGQTVTVSGTVTNTTAAPITGMTVQLLSSATPFGSRSELQEFAAGYPLPDYPVPGTSVPVTTLAPRASTAWSIRLPVNRIGMTGFGVYPLAAQASSAAGAVLDTDNTFLPFWPGKKAADPQPDDIAWIWPLIDQPRQAVCAALLNNGLAASLEGGGRLAGLLAAGAAYSASAHLTWAIDPALLASVNTMTSPYRVGGSASCAGGTRMPASQAARTWLAKLRAAIAGQPVFVTPYADIDVAAVTRASLDTDLARAYAEGRSVASAILGRNFSAGITGSSAGSGGGSAGSGGGSAGSGTAAGQATSDLLNSLAWPAGGIADYAVLENLAATAGITAVVLDSSTMPPSSPVSYTPSAQTSTPDGVGPDLHVLLSDDTITQILGSASSASDSPATSFAVAQRYLAETAMIAAQAPNLPRSIVVAPPQRWDPPAGLAATLLSETVSAPWLRTVSLGQLATATSASGQVSRRPPNAVSAAELSPSLLREVRQLDHGVHLLQSIREHPDPALYTAVAAVESSAWRGGGAAARQAQLLLNRVSGYVSSQESQLRIIGLSRVTLGGLKGPVPVSIDNRLGYPVRVMLTASSAGGTIAVKGVRTVISVPARAEITIKLKVSAARVGSTTLSLGLLTPGGQPLPVRPVLMTVQATHYGTLALVIIAAALAVFMLTSAARPGRGRRTRCRRPPRAGPGAGSR